MAFNITAVIVLILAAFAIVVSVVGILKFLDAFDAEYSNTTYHRRADGRICQDEKNSECLLQQDERFSGIRDQGRPE